MKTFISIFFLLNSALVVKAQGAWDMKYVSIDSLNDNWVGVGKEIRLDFKSSQSDTLGETINIYELLSKRDTVTLGVDGKEISFKEDWRFYVDHGVLSDQNLKTISDKHLINEMFVESVNDSTITVKMSFYKSKKCKYEKLILSESKLVTINRKIIKGVLYRRNDE